MSITGKNSSGSMGIILFIKPLTLLWSGRWPLYTLLPSCYLHEHQYQCWSGIDFHSTGSKTDFWLVCSRNISCIEIGIKQANTWYNPQRSLVPTIRYQAWQYQPGGVLDISVDTSVGQLFKTGIDP